VVAGGGGVVKEKGSARCKGGKKENRCPQELRPGKIKGEGKEEGAGGKLLG